MTDLQGVLLWVILIVGGYLVGGPSGAFAGMLILAALLWGYENGKSSLS